MTVLSMIFSSFISNFSAMVGFGEAWVGLCLTIIWSVIDIRLLVIKVVFGFVSVFVTLVDSASCWLEFVWFVVFVCRFRGFGIWWGLMSFRVVGRGTGDQSRHFCFAGSVPRKSLGCWYSS